MANKQLLIVFHSQSGRNQRLALACYAKARENAAVNVRLLRAIEADSQAVLACDALLFIGPEMNALPSGGIKDFLDRVFYPLERAGKQGLPYALIIGCGNAGDNTEKQLDKIALGIKAKKIQPALIVHGEPDTQAIQAASDLAEALAEGLVMGIF